MVRAIVLKRWNIAMSILMLSAFAACLGYFVSEDNIDVEFPLFYYSSEATGGTSYKLVLKQSKIGVYPQLEVTMFFFITGMFHMIYAINFLNFYEEQVYVQKTNLFRWIEYAITATLMMRVIASSAGVYDVGTMSLITAGTIVIMLCGYVVEKSLAMKVGSIAYTTTFFAWLLEIVIFVIVFTSFSSVMNGFNNSSDKEKVPSFIYAILFTQLVFYSSFGIVQLTQVIKFAKNNVDFDYSNYEVVYLILSFASKFVLGSLVAYGSTRQPPRVNL